MPPRPTIDNPFVWSIADVRVRAIQWTNDRRCSFCGIPLLNTEKDGWCCMKGTRLTKPLPPLPFEFQQFINSPDISSISRVFNLIFSFAALETEGSFPSMDIHGPPGFFAASGRMYHRVRPSIQNSGTHWLLFDGYEPSRAPHQRWASIIPPNWVTLASTALKRVNPFVDALIKLHDLAQNHPEASVVLSDQSTQEIAAIFHTDNTSVGSLRSRELLIQYQNGRNQKIGSNNRLWEPLVYPLLFPHGSLGWGLTNDNDGLLNEDDNTTGDVTNLSWHIRGMLLREARFKIFGYLANEYAVDMFSRVLERRLNLIKSAQLRFAAEDASLMGRPFIPENENVFLPASFMGSKQWCADQTTDSLALASRFPPSPTFWVTFTCNSDWPEIRQHLLPGQTWRDQPFLVVRVFKAKVTQFISVFPKLFPNAGGVDYHIERIEFQKRGLPHAHMLFKFRHDLLHPQDIDRIVSAEMPQDPDDAALIEKFMLHHHPNADRPLSSYCQKMVNGERICRFQYPHPINNDTYIDNEGRVHYRRRTEQDGMVVEHNLPLIRLFQCHINVQIASTSHIFQYLFKYINKGVDRTRYTVRVREDGTPVIDEVDDYLRGRYLSSAEAIWRIAGFHITRKTPSVETLPVHLPHSRRRRVYQQRHRPPGLSLLDRYFLRPSGTFMLHEVIMEFKALTYCKYYELFRLSDMRADLLDHPNHYVERAGPIGTARKLVILRSRDIHITKIELTNPSHKERFYLAALLKHRPMWDWADATKVNGEEQGTYQQAACELGLFATESETEAAIREGIEKLLTPRELRHLFIWLLLDGQVTTPMDLWSQFRYSFAQDHILQLGNNNDLAFCKTLWDMTHLLEEHGKTLEDFGLPQPTVHGSEVLHELEKWAPYSQLLASRARHKIDCMNNEQLSFFNDLLHAIDQNQPFTPFVVGGAGRGKSFAIEAALDLVRSKGQIAIATATSAFAAQIYPGGKTAHSVFKIPVNKYTEFLESLITTNSSRADLLRQAVLIIWDETPMANKAAVECVDAMLRRIMNNDSPFGGKVFVALGDFRQTCPVIRRGGRAEIVSASIRSSYLWPTFKLYHMTIPIRQQNDPIFANFVDAIGNGAGPNVEIPFVKHGQSADDLIDFVFPPTTLHNPIECSHRSILAPLNRQIDLYNEKVIQRISGNTCEYLSADKLKEANAVGLATSERNAIIDTAARFPPPGFPAHQLIVKTNTMFRLLRNLSVDKGLVKNKRVIIIALGRRIITIQCIEDRHSPTDPRLGEIFHLPRITFEEQLHNGHTLQRLQFPIAPAYATTFNSCQGLTLDRVAIDLTHQVFSHGQLYTALSRIRHRSHAMIRLRPGESSTTNVTFNELLL